MYNIKIFEKTNTCVLDYYYSTTFLSQILDQSVA